MSDGANETGLELENFLPYRLARAAELVSRDFAEIYKGQAGLTRPEWRAFATIGQFGNVTATFIGQHSSMHKTKVSRAVAALEKRKWIKRHQDADDRRVEHLSLTKKGAGEYRSLASLARKFEADLKTRIGLSGSQSIDSGLVSIEDCFEQTNRR